MCGIWRLSIDSQSCESVHAPVREQLPCLAHALQRRLAHVGVEWRGGVERVHGVDRPQLLVGHRQGRRAAHLAPVLEVQANGRWWRVPTVDDTACKALEVATHIASKCTFKMRLRWSRPRRHLNIAMSQGCESDIAHVQGHPHLEWLLRCCMHSSSSDSRNASGFAAPPNAASQPALRVLRSTESPWWAHGSAQHT